MPRKYVRKRRIRKKRVYRNYGIGGRTRYSVNIAKPMARLGYGILPNGGLPDKCFTKFVYMDNIKLTGTGTTTVAQVYQYRINSLFDCDLTGTGHQPYMRDQLTAFYKYACIYGCKVEICVNAMSTTTQPHLVVVRATRQSSSPTNITLESERAFSKQVCVNAGGADSKRIKMYVPLHKLFGIRKSTLEDDDFRITIGSNPSQVAYLNIVQAPIPDTDTTAQDLAYTIKLSFYTKLWSVVDQIES